MSNARSNVTKLTSLINVKAFGAKGDGTTDDRHGEHFSGGTLGSPALATFVWWSQAGRLDGFSTTVVMHCQPSAIRYIAL